MQWIIVILIGIVTVGYIIFRISKKNIKNACNGCNSYNNCALKDLKNRKSC